MHELYMQMRKELHKPHSQGPQARVLNSALHSGLAEPDEGQAQCDLYDTVCACAAHPLLLACNKAGV